MPARFYSRSALRATLLFSFVALLPLSACGKRQKPQVVYRQGTPQPVNPHFVTITWTASTSKVFGYNVYRSSGAAKSQKIEKITDGIVFGTQYTDHTAIGGQTYTYYVTAVDFKGLESKPSAKFTVTVPTTIASPSSTPASPPAGGTSSTPSPPATPKP